MQFLTTTTESYISLFFTLALMLVLLYFMIYRPQKKQEKKDAAMRAALEIGDQVTTIGGVIGRVVAIKDDTFVLETGSDRVKIRFTKSAISSLENALEPSSCAAALEGPNTGRPRRLQTSARPATSGASGPTTVRSMLFSSA